MTDWYTENRQNRELEDLRSEMSQAMYEASNLRSRLSEVQGGLESRLSRLTDAFDAFVELSDIRYDLIGFADASELRRHAGQVLAALASGEKPPTPGRGVPGYWLEPAIEALRGLSADAADLPDEPFGRAMALDERRTATFLCLALSALGRRNLVRTAWLDTAFGTVAADGTVTRVQRALWTTGARGGFGAEGLKLVVERLQEQAKASTKSWSGFVESRTPSVKRSGPAFSEIAVQAEAQARLSRLRTAVETIAGDTTVREPDSDLGYVAGEPDPDSASAVLRMLISEGSEPERGPLARVAELRARITDSKKAGSIEDSAGTVEKLLADDLRRADEPHLNATALRAVADAVLREAEELAKTASGPSPAQVDWEHDWQHITLLPDGPEPQSMAVAEAKINATAPPLTLRRLAGPAVTAVIGLLVAVGLGLTHPAWIAVGVVTIAIAAYYFQKARKRTAAAQADAVDRIARLREKATQAAAELATYRADAGDRETSIAADLEGVRKQLA
jgi:hypothetical protein